MLVCFSKRKVRKFLEEMQKKKVVYCTFLGREGAFFGLFWRFFFGELFFVVVLKPTL